MMPNSSWVARWNNLEGGVPGVYALQVLEDSYDHEEQDVQIKGKKKVANYDGAYSDEDYETYY